MVMQTNGINYYTPGWNNGTYIPPVQNPMGGYTAPQYVPQPTIPQPQQTFVQPNQIRPVNGRVVSSEEDKQRMRDASNEHMMETMSTIREMWDDADPDLRTRMKADLTNLVTNLK